MDRVNQIIAIGEIGLEDLTDAEISVFKRQLDIASETDSKVIIHTPRKNKKEVLDVILDILPQHLDESQAVIDHINPNVVCDVIDTDCMLGLTVQPQKMDKFEAISILDEYGFDKFLLNSDISNKPSDPLSVPKTVNELKNQGYENSEIEKVASINAQKFFNL
jgi:predicted metal-dependent TIM-barrel fold hydrolase